MVQSGRFGIRSFVFGALMVASLVGCKNGTPVVSTPALVTDAIAGTTSAQQVGVNKPAPPLELKDINGKTVKLSDYKGKVVVLNFWATWCPPCRKEIPGFIELQNQYGTKGLQFLGVALDEEGLSKVKPYVDKNPISYPILIGDPKGVARYGEMGAIPVTFIIDKKGVIRQNYVGMRMKSVIESAVTPLMAE